MPPDERKRQKKLERKKAKRREALATLQAQAIAGGTGFNNPLAPVQQCYVSESLFQQGIGPAIVSRAAAHGQIALAVYLLDVWCLGVKNAYCRVLTPFKFREHIRQTNQGSRLASRSPAYVKKLVLDAERWAQSLGIEPHPDYQQAKRLLDGINSEECTEQFTFGNDHMPYYVQGPRDSSLKVNHIMSALRRTCGDGKFHYLLVASSETELANLAAPNANVFAINEDELPS